MVLVGSNSTGSMDSVTHDVAPTILRRAISSGMSSPERIDDDAKEINDDDGRELVLLFLGCEAKPPYGPYLHTAGLFLDLLEVAAKERRRPPSSGPTSIVLKVYPVSQGIFPTTQDLADSDGVILPGSFNSAYDDEKWIHQLKGLIQNDLVARAIPALGVCFGHQIYAHSFDGGDGNDGEAIGQAGLAVKCPAGPQAGRKTAQLTEAGIRYLRQSSLQEKQNEHSGAEPTTINIGPAAASATTTMNLDLFYTHGDMVEKLPQQGVPLVGNDKVPIQAAIYFGQDSSSNDGSISDGADTPLETPSDVDPRVIAVTFQAHPEYASSIERGLEGTLRNIIHEMAHRGDITPEEARHAHEDAILQYELVREHSIDAIISACELLGWFPAAARK